MSTLSSRYSGLITKGLGLPACQGMITMNFHVFLFQANIGGGGGGPIPVGKQYIPYYTPANGTTPFGTSNRVQHNRTVDITIKFASSPKTWRKSFMITEGQAKHVIKIINIVNRLRSKIRFNISDININNLKSNIMFNIANIKQSIKTTFKSDDK